jgi:hypothetical protein
MPPNSTKGTIFNPEVYIRKRDLSEAAQQVMPFYEAKATCAASERSLFLVGSLGSGRRANS